MPIPKPSKDETKEKFISRCMGDDVMNKEFPDRKRRAGVCFSQWKRVADASWMPNKKEKKNARRS